MYSFTHKNSEDEILSQKTIDGYTFITTILSKSAVENSQDPISARH